MKFKDLTKDQKSEIIKRESDDLHYALKYDVHPRTIRKWRKRTTLEKAKDNYYAKTYINRKVLAIGDLHAPFDLDDYINHCKKVYKKYNCDTVVFIGDIIDNHYTSYHETDPDGMSGGNELALSIKRLRKWYEAFPEAFVTIGNHDRLIMRKAQTSAIPKAWIKSYKEVLGVPNWEFVHRLIIDDVQYIHGEAGTARTKAKADMMSTVQGHLHTQMYVEWFTGANYKIFALQIGCGIDHESYAMAYAKAGKKPAIGCAVIDKGEVAFNVPMNLG